MAYTPCHGTAILFRLAEQISRAFAHVALLWSGTSARQTGTYRCLHLFAAATVAIVRRHQQLKLMATRLHSTDGDTALSFRIESNAI